MSKDLFMQEREQESLTPVTEEMVIDYILSQVDKSTDGKIEPLKAYIRLKRIADVCAASIKELQDQAIDDALRYGEKQFEVNGAKVEVKSAPGKWEFDGIQSYAVISQRLKNIQEMAKQAYKLKTEILDPETGELIQPAKFTDGKQTISISFKK